MTSSEVKTSENLTHSITTKKMEKETVVRKASFKCSIPKKPISQKTARKVVLPMSTVQALTFKFNELSQMNQNQKHKISQTAVKNILGVNGKQSTIKVVICRKPSASKYKRPDDLFGRRRMNIKKFQTADIEVFGESKIHKNVLKKISDYEDMKRAKTDLSLIKKRTVKMQVPKVLVDIDLGGENHILSEKEPIQDKSQTENLLQENSLSVKTAINLFEKCSNCSIQEKKIFHTHVTGIDVNTNSENESIKENIQEVKPKPIAAIKPILKKPEVKDLKKSKLSPKDSLNRKKYLAMKRELLKEGADVFKSEMESLNFKEEKENLERKNQEDVTSVLNKETEKKFKNDSSLHKHILQSTFTMITDEIPLNENTLSKHIPNAEHGNIHQTLKPNTSFLWSKKEDLTVEKKAFNRMDLPLPVPPENFIPDIIDSNDVVYDDARSASQTFRDEDLEKITDSDEETYDDVSICWKNNENNSKTSFLIKNNLRENITEKNVKNEDSNLKVSDDFCQKKEKYFYFYDDVEGERYQYISDKCETIDNLGKLSDSELYQYIQDVKDDSNIYEDIQSVKSNLKSKDKNKDIYEDINCGGNSVTDNAFVSNCYESVYNRIYSVNNETQGYLKSDISDTSNNSGRSTYEKNNSLYGISAVNITEKDHCLNPGEANDVKKNSIYHSSLYGSTYSNSEASQSNSDEWVEVSETESEQTIYLVHERPKKTKSIGKTWMQKERRRWKRMQKKKEFLEEETKLQNSEDHLYESVVQYENSDIIHQIQPITLHTQQPHNLNKDQFYEEEQFIDDFDSQSSEGENYIDNKLPDVPNHGYNITKSLKAAGQKLRKNFSLRKSDLSKSLKKLKKTSRPKVTEAIFSSNKEVEVDCLTKFENPSTPTNLSNSLYSNNSDSSSGSQNITKSISSSNVINQRHRKSWTFRNKFKNNCSIETDSVDTNRNSTFYLSLNEIQNKKVEQKDDLINEIQTVLSQRNNSSPENVPDKEGTSRFSDNGSALTKPRPNVPPPPPPSFNKVESVTDKTKYSDILWGEKANNNSLYVESGLFNKQKKHTRCTESDASLYAEIGLYAVNDDLTSNKKTQMFLDEPLYQFYTECVNQRARDDILNNYDSEGYEEINDFYSVINEKRRTIDIKNVRPNFEDFNEDMRPKVASLRSISDRRTLWCQIPAVISSCILESLSDQARKLQEAKFEILTSEGSYMNSLNVLESHFMKKVGDLNMISKRDFRILFGNIVAVKKCSENFLEDLESCWQNNIMLNGICDIVHKHATTSFHVYIKYCKNQVCIYRTLRELIDKNPNFESALKEIENDSICQNLNIHSFLMLPMQRITRLPLLLGAVLARMDKTDDEYDICKASFDVLNKIVQDCDDEARRMEKCEEMLILSQQIEFPKAIRRIPIITGSRFLVKSGQVTQLVNRDENKLTFGKKFSKVSLTLFLFTDLLIVAKKKNIRNYIVVDHCPRNLVQMQTTDGLSQLPVKLNTNTDMGGKLLMLLTMLENHEKKTVEMILSFEMESDRQRWLDAVTPKLSENPDECIYEEWDCPQVISLYEFTPSQPDELNLCIGDVVNVLKKMNDGWYQGERLRDGAKGWFPQNHTQEISSSHVRAKNKKLRYKLLALSGNLIDSQKINGK